MPRITVNVSEETAEWLESEADALGASKARTGGHCIEVMQNTVQHIDLHRSSLNQTESICDKTLQDRLDDLEQRVDELEAARQADTPSSETASADGGATERRERPETPASDQAEDTHAPEPAPSAAADTADAISRALDGWSHGRSDAEREASQRVAREATEWLRDRSSVTPLMATPPTLNNYSLNRSLRSRMLATAQEIGPSGSPPVPLTLRSSLRDPCEGPIRSGPRSRRLSLSLQYPNQNSTQTTGNIDKI